MPASRARRFTGEAVTLLAAARRPVGLGDHRHHVVARQQRLEGGQGEGRGAVEQDAQSRLARAGEGQVPWPRRLLGEAFLLDLPLDAVPRHRSQAVDEQHAVEVIHLVLDHAGQESRARLERTAPVRSIAST